MVTAWMSECLLLVVLVMAISVLPADGASCGPGSIRCSSTSKCIRHTDLCDGSPDCPVLGEDEDTTWCSMYSRRNDSCGRDSTWCGSSDNCMTWPEACNTQKCLSYASSRAVCKAITSDLLPGEKVEPAPGLPPQIDINQLASFMSATSCSLERTSDSTNKSPDCPQLYTSIGNMCIAPLPFVLTWPEASIACQSIAGKLLEVEFVETFGEIVQFLINADFSSNFWIGGFYDNEREDWIWSSGPKMPRSTPYWALKHISSCVPRRSPTLGALPGCFHYQQAPTSQGPGYCAALQFEDMYYIRDYGCYQKKQPLCIH